MPDWAKIQAELKNDEESPREREPDPTQERMDEEGAGDRPVDVDRTEDETDSV